MANNEGWVWKMKWNFFVIVIFIRNCTEGDEAVKRQMKIPTQIHAYIPWVQSGNLTWRLHLAW